MSLDAGTVSETSGARSMRNRAERAPPSCLAETKTGPNSLLQNEVSRGAVARDHQGAGRADRWMTRERQLAAGVKIRTRRAWAGSSGGSTKVVSG